MENNTITLNEIGTMEPIEMAQFLINLTILESGEVTTDTEAESDRVPVFNACALEEIAEHLLAYTKYTGKRNW